MFSVLKKVFGGRSEAKSAKPVTTTTRPEVEALGERVLPSSVPMLTGDTINLDGPYSSGRQLRILSEADKGNGTGTFQGLYTSPWGVAYVSGSIALKHVGSNTNPNNPYDFAVSYSGGGAGLAAVFGSGDFKCNYVSDPSAYGHYQTGLSSWSYSGSDTVMVNWALYTGGPPRYYAWGYADADYSIAIIH